MLPVSLYIHFPWCILKCPYCDFNSHKSPDVLPEKSYIQALLQDLDQDLAIFPVSNIHSIFMGGGTPSLFSAESMHTLLTELANRFPMDNTMEITMEANPGTFEQQKFTDFRQAGINRLSIGIQSFNPAHLKTLGRVHDRNQALSAIENARIAGFDNINLDIMHGLPEQTVEEGLADLKTALSFQPEHLSWYQLTIEPNTAFYKTQPVLPPEEEAQKIEQQGLELLLQQHYNRYEISAFSKPNRESRHNMNYWLFGDYLGIGAGAHGKITTNQGITRTRKHKQPALYLTPDKPFLVESTLISESDSIFECMMNTTRLEDFITFQLFEERTGLDSNRLLPILKKAEHTGLIDLYEKGWQITPLGRRFTNDLQTLFLQD